MSLGMHQTMGMELHQKLCQEQRLEVQQRQIGLQNLCLLSQRLKNPDNQHAQKGLAGIQIADTFLKQRNAVGVLIGSLVKTLWMNRGDPDTHKDVDVMVVTDNFLLQQPFEQGIDWWIPQIRKLRIDGVGGYSENIPVKWWENGNNIIPHFGLIPTNKELSYGLHIPNMEWYIEMRTVEALSQVDPRIEGVIDEDVIRKFQDSIRGRISDTLNPKVKRMSPQIVTPLDVFIAATELECIRAIRTMKRCSQENKEGQNIQQVQNS